MYAIIKTGGKQYRVTKGEKLKLEKLDAEIGKKVVFDEVLSVGEGADLEIGTPYLKDATVEAKVIDEGNKVLFKKVNIVEDTSDFMLVTGLDMIEKLIIVGQQYVSNGEEVGF